MRVRVRVTSDTAISSMSRLGQNLRNLPNDAFREWRRRTPRRTGNAQNSTRLSGDTIEANYDYARRLDQGYSRQAPRGMFKPTFDYVVRLLREMIRK